VASASLDIKEFAAIIEPSSADPIASRESQRTKGGIVRCVQATAPQLVIEEGTLKANVVRDDYRTIEVGGDVAGYLTELWSLA
jgi:hypothetical protein